MGRKFDRKKKQRDRDRERERERVESRIEYFSITNYCSSFYYILLNTLKFLSVISIYYIDYKFISEISVAESVFFSLYLTTSEL